MDIGHAMMSRLSGTSQTNSHSTDTAKSRHSRKPSYEEVKTLSTVDYLVTLCAGHNAAFRLERKRTLAYFQSLPDTHVTIAPEDWANAVGGEIVGERVVQPSFRTPWTAPNSGIKFRYRLHGSGLSTSCSTNCTTFEHHAYRPSFESRRSSTTTLYSPRTAIICDIPDGKISHLLEHPSHVDRYKSSFATAALPEVVKAHEKRSPLDLAGACAPLERVGSTKELVEDGFQEQSNTEYFKEEERDNGGSVHQKDEDRKAEQSEPVPVTIQGVTSEACLDTDEKETKHVAVAVRVNAAARQARQYAQHGRYFESVRENADIRSYFEENSGAYFSLTKEAKFEARRAESRDCYEPSNVEDFLGEEVALVKERSSVSASLRKKAQFQAGRAELKKSHRRPKFKGTPGGEEAHFRATRNTYTRGSQSQAKPSEPKTFDQRFKSHSKHVRFITGPRQRSYQRPPFEDIPEEETTCFTEYPNTFASIKNPTEHTPLPEKRRINRAPGYFVNTPWEMQPPATGHCKEFIQQRDYKPLALRHTIDPAIAARNVAIRQALIIERRRGQPVPPFFVPKRGPPRPTRKYTGRANVKPVYRCGPTPRPVYIPAAQTSVHRGPQRHSLVKKVEKDQDCAIESSFDEEDMETSAEWDPTCYVEPEQ